MVAVDGHGAANRVVGGSARAARGRARLESEHRGDEQGEERTRPRRRVRPEGLSRVGVGNQALRAGAREDVGRARGEAGVIVVGGSGHDGVSVDGHGAAELVARRGVVSRQLGHLAVRGAAVGRGGKT